jgi:hypothetical protein
VAPINVARPTWWLRPFGIPCISAYTLASFRLVIGVALLLILLFYDPIRSIPLDRQYAYSPVAAAHWVRWLAASETATQILQILACAAALFFAIGIRPKPAYIILVAILTLHAVMLLLRRGWLHDWGLPLTTLLALVVVPWGESPRLTLRGRAAADVERISRAYGFALWLPGLTLGLAFAAAAYAKLRRSGLEWITNGTVRYHFVEDGANAPVDLGLWIATQPGVSVGLSLAAVIVEASFFLVVFVPSWRTRAVFGAIGITMMVGFFLFQGVLWWPWWMLFAAFLPWNQHDRPRYGMSGRELTWAQALLVPVLVASQLWVSSRQFELEPFLSSYPMYANTYDSPQHYDAHHRRIRFHAAGRDISEQVGHADGESILTALAQQTTDSAIARSELAEFVERYTRLYGPPPHTIDVLTEPPFDWQRGRYLDARLVGKVRLVQDGD